MGFSARIGALEIKNGCISQYSYRDNFPGCTRYNRNWLPSKHIIMNVNEMSYYWSDLTKIEIKDDRHGQEWTSPPPDHARIRICVLAMAKSYVLGYELLPYCPCSPDLTPTHHFLSPKFAKWLVGKRFVSNDNTISKINLSFEDIDKLDQSRG